MLLFLRQCIVASFILLFTTTAFGAPSLKDYGLLPSTSMMEISPSGKKIAFRKSTADKDLLVVYSLSEKKTLLATDISEINPSYTYFISETKLVIVASQYRRIYGFKDTHNVSTAFTIDIKNQKIEQLLTPGHKIYKGQTGLGDIVSISQNRKYAYMPAYVGRSETDHSPNYSLVRVEIDKPKRLKVIEKGHDDSRDYFMDNKDRVIAQTRYDQKSNIYEVLVPEKKGWKVIYSQEMPILSISMVGSTPDFKSLIMLADNSKTGRSDYYLMSLTDGEITPSRLGRDDKDIEGVITDVNRVAYGVRYSGFTPSYHFFDKKLDERIQNALQKFPEHSVWLTSHSNNWKHFITRVEGSNYAGDYILFDDKNKPSFLGTQRPNIKPGDINPIGTLTYKAADGLEIPTLLTIPKSKVGSLKNLPAVVLPHGGPASYDRIGFDWLAQSIASQGYLVVQPQFRGSEGFGASFNLAGNGEWGKKMQSDITDGVLYLTQKGIIDPKRVCIAGASYGGYAALAGGAFTPEIYQCVVSIAGVSDLPRMLKEEKSQHGKHHWAVSYWESNIANNELDKNALKEISPAFHAQNFTAPVLLMHGERDKIVSYKQSKVMRSALKKADKEVKLIKLEDENHHLIEGQSRLLVINKMIEFFNAHIGEKATRPAP
ncbi:alpha/beta hydrolase family protein [Marinagarivorans cellulosilyticus]|uniref:Peptidase S9 prolyl oligopeptidase catalytic domain-containing protein n=1 Tax=Marinagarivorans cellulosilyticus TaxID=2721545 RepID=A0AAN1WI12_9GAMM|nr:prolyl oligopeptidase family serine peptidase [Marinagarivorans cellulosilyticus]BCD97988.1 hypothetical protein MARGE09_P2189 [Marinagarivorans cellulosilyticus]